MSALSVLHRALDFLEAHPAAHCTDAIARDKNGRKVTADSPYAEAWDVHGVMLHITRRDRLIGDLLLAADALHEAARELGHSTARQMNDARGYEGCVAMYRRAIARYDDKKGQGV